ncbi:MAG: HlyD family efflux transporter periplasmic adaptor subunit [Pseudomonadota bacterium]|nr:HlyD family efflux transporter periplasmic adaptor subunit [Pseudomonadota bacterium]
MENIVDTLREQRPKGRWRSKRAITGYVAALLVLAAALILTPLRGAAYKVDGNSLIISPVEQGALSVRVRGNGLLRPRIESTLSAQVDGRVEMVHARAGATLAKGDPIVTLSNPAVNEAADVLKWQVRALSAEYRALEQTLRSSQLDLRVSLLNTETAYEDSNLQLEREAALIKHHGQLISELEHRRTQRSASQLKQTLVLEEQRLRSFRLKARADLAAKNAQISEVREQLARAEQQVDALQVRAPIAGVLQESQLTNGQQVAVGQSLARVSDTSSLYAELHIPEQQARELVLGQPAEIDTRNGLVKGLVTRVDPAVTNGIVKVDVEFVGPPPAGLRPDLSIEGNVAVATIASTLYVLRPTFARPSQGVHVYKLVDDDSAERVLVQFGRSSDSHIAVTSGLSVGDRIITSDTSTWGDPQRISLAK